MSNYGKRLSSGAKRILSRRLPMSVWLRKYTAEQAVGDAIAGVTVGLTVMPQALAYATLAGLEPQYGLYSAFAGCFVYAIFGSCQDITIGPTALMSLMTYQQVVNKNPDFAILLCFLSGLVQILMALFNLGMLIDFISVPVTVGFTSATSVIIAVSQLKSLLGLKIASNSFLDTVKEVYNNIDQSNPWDYGLGIGCIIILLLLRKIKDIKLTAPGSKPTNRQRIVEKSLWLLSTSRNAIIVITCSFLAYYFETSWTEGSPFVLTGRVRSGLPEFKPPPFQTTVGNVTYNFEEMCNELGSSIILVPVIAVLGNVAIAKAFASGDSVDATQELITLSLCNVVGSFTSSMPVTGSFSRSAVNHASGVKTPMGGVYTGVLVLLALTFLTPYFYYIPRTSLAAVIVCAVVFMIEYEVVRPMWRSSRRNVLVAAVTFVLCLIIGVERGVLAGVAVDLVFLLHTSARPKVQVERITTSFGIEYLLVTPENSLYFPAVDFIRTSVGKAGIKQGSSQLPVVVDCRYVLGADFTAAKGISALIEDFNKRKQPIYFYRPRDEVVAVFKGAALDDFQHISTRTELDFVLNDRQVEEAKNINDEELTLLQQPTDNISLARIPSEQFIDELTIESEQNSKPHFNNI